MFQLYVVNGSGSIMVKYNKRFQINIYFFKVIKQNKKKMLI